MRVCESVSRWVEKTIEEPVRVAREREERTCRERPWYDPRRWWCEIVIVVEYVIEYVVKVIRVLVTEIVCRIVEVALIAAGFLLNLIQSIPIIGGIVKSLLGLVRWVFGLIVGLIAAGVEAIFGRGKKTLRVRVVILNDGNGPLATEEDMVQQIETANRAFGQCDVRVRLDGMTVYRDRKNAEDLLNFSGCGDFWAFMDQTFWTRGSQYELASGDSDYEANWRRFLPFGGYITIFVVRDIDGKIGCSNGPLYDFVVVEGRAVQRRSAQLDPTLVAHELGHACALVHDDDNQPNLMWPNAGRGTALRSGQCFWIRSSQYVTYL